MLTQGILKDIFTGGKCSEILKTAPTPPLPSLPWGSRRRSPRKIFLKSQMVAYVLAHFDHEIMHLNTSGFMSAASSFQTNFYTFDLKSWQCTAEQQNIGFRPINNSILEL
jgi:hypothetical protein